MVSNPAPDGITRPSTNVGGIDLPQDHWVAAMGMDLAIEPSRITARTELVPAMFSPSGRVRLGVLATMVDVVGGHVPSGPLTPTIDLRIQLLGPALHGPAVLRGTAKKVGARLVMAETTLRGPDGALFALGTTTFMNQPIASDPLGELRPTSVIPSFDALLDARAVDDATLEMEPTPLLSNGSGRNVQGGVQAALAELAAERLLGEAATMVDLDIRYLNRVKVGPLRATATLVGRTGPLSSVRVDLTDRGDDDRVVAFVALLAAH